MPISEIVGIEARKQFQQFVSSHQIWTLDKFDEFAGKSKGCDVDTCSLAFHSSIAATSANS